MKPEPTKRPKKDDDIKASGGDVNPDYSGPSYGVQDATWLEPDPVTNANDQRTSLTVPIPSTRHQNTKNEWKLDERSRTSERRRRSRQPSPGRHAMHAPRGEVNRMSLVENTEDRNRQNR